MVHDWKRLLLVVALAFGGALWACTDTPVSPESGTAELTPQLSNAGGNGKGNNTLSTTSTESDPDLSKVARFKRSGADTLYIGQAQKWICPAGGSLEVFGFEAIFPEGAVSECTKITIKLDVSTQRSKQQDHVVAEFKPHMQFNVPVTLRVPYEGTTAEDSGDLDILWWTSNGWVTYEGTLTDDGRVQTQTDHFSTWAKDGGFGTAGGLY